MDLPEELAKKLDFSHGKKFQKEILQLFGSSVHHTLATPTGTFFLLVTFHHYTFRLTEESVAFALASCLGGAPAGFHIQYQSVSLWLIKQWVFMFMLFGVSLPIILMLTFISGEMGQPIGRKKNAFGSWSSKKSGLKSCLKVKSAKLDVLRK